MRKMKEFNQKEYIQQYQKDHYSIFKVKLKKEEKKELDELLNKVGLNQAQFLRNAIQKLKEELKMKEIKNDVK